MNMTIFNIELALRFHNIEIGNIVLVNQGFSHSNLRLPQVFPRASGKIFIGSVEFILLEVVFSPLIDRNGGKMDATDEHLLSWPYNKCLNQLVQSVTVCRLNPHTCQHVKITVIVA